MRRRRIHLDRCPVAQLPCRGPARQAGAHRRDLRTVAHTPFEPLAMRQHATDLYPFDPNLVSQESRPTTRVTLNDSHLAPAAGHPEAPGRLGRAGGPGRGSGSTAVCRAPRPAVGSDLAPLDQGGYFTAPALTPPAQGGRRWRSPPYDPRNGSVRDTGRQRFPSDRSGDTEWSAVLKDLLPTTMTGTGRVAHAAVAGRECRGDHGRRSGLVGLVRRPPPPPTAGPSTDVHRHLERRMGDEQRRVPRRAERPQHLDHLDAVQHPTECTGVTSDRAGRAPIYQTGGVGTCFIPDWMPCYDGGGRRAAGCRFPRH